MTEAQAYATASSTDQTYDGAPDNDEGVLEDAVKSESAHYSSNGTEDDKEGGESSLGKRRRENEVKLYDSTDRRTLVVFNLPNDTTQREFNNFLYFFEGFSKSRLLDNSTQSVPVPDPSTSSSSHAFVAFALFENQNHALAAKERIDGTVFDPAAPAASVIVSRLAVKNLVLTKDDITQNSKRPKYANVYHQPLTAAYDASGAAVDHSAAYAQMYPNYAPVPPTPPVQSYPPPPPASSSLSSSSGGNPACNTLFLCRLPSFLSDQDVVQVLTSTFPAILQHKLMVDSKGQRVAFIQFDSPDTAGAAMSWINTTGGKAWVNLPSHAVGQNVSISAAFSKNPLGQKRGGQSSASSYGGGGGYGYGSGGGGYGQDQYYYQQGQYGGYGASSSYPSNPYGGYGGYQ